MPVYAYACPVCGHTEEKLRSVAARNDPTACPLGHEMVRDMIAEQVHSTDQEYDRPILSDALGVHPSQIDDAKRRFPHHEFAPDGRLIIRSHAQRNRIMKELGYVDHDGYN